jgi:hypothetical protein
MANFYSSRGWRLKKPSAMEKLAANGPDQTFDERMRNWHLRNRFDLVDFEYAQVGELAMFVALRKAARRGPLGLRSRS